MTYWCLALATFVGVLTPFILSGGHSFEKTPSGSVQFWASNWNPSAQKLGELNDIDAVKDHCVAPEKYEFCDSPECSWSARELQCIDICSNRSNQECMEPAERFIKTGTGLFFPTFIAETTTVRNGSLRQNPETKWRIPKGVEDMGISFQHDYNIYTQESLVKKQARQEGSSRSFDSSYGDGLLTVLEDLDGNEVSRWEPGQLVIMTLRQILKAAKISLDSVYLDKDANIGRNFLEGAHIPDGILMRLAGAEITLELLYHNPATSRTSDWSGPVCYVRIQSLPVWTSQTVLQVVDQFGSQRFQYQHGVRISFKSGGTFAWVSIEQLLNKFTQLLVFLKCVKQFIFWLSIYGLGVVSKVYKGFIFQRASLSKEACGMAARLTSHTSTFVELQDTAYGISEERLRRRFKRIFAQSAELDEGEIHRFVNFVFKRMAKNLEHGIDVQDFSQSCSHGEALHFKTLVELFDADRKKGILERTFAGPTMRSLFQEMKDCKAHEFPPNPGFECSQTVNFHNESCSALHRLQQLDALPILRSETLVSQSSAKLCCSSSKSDLSVDSSRCIHGTIMSNQLLMDFAAGPYSSQAASDQAEMKSMNDSSTNIPVKATVGKGEMESMNSTDLCHAQDTIGKAGAEVYLTSQRSTLTSNLYRTDLRSPPGSDRNSEALSKPSARTWSVSRLQNCGPCSIKRLEIEDVESRSYLEQGQSL